MPCYHHIDAYRYLTRKTESGKSEIVFKKPTDLPYEEIKLPCGQCIGCRLDRSAQWALRCMYESQFYEHNCFITLTYDDEHLPENGSLDKSHYQKFMKRLRKKYSGFKAVKGKYPIRFFQCGEYGELLKRPHFHACIFNFDFIDKKLLTQKGDCRLYISAALAQLWPYGYHTIGDVTFESCAYVARYITKKVLGKAADEHYNNKLNTETGEIYNVVPEYITMSRRPGIGRDFFDHFPDDLFPKDFIVFDERRFKVPKYYDALYEKIDAEHLAEIKKSRKEKAERHRENNTSERIRVREKIAQKKLKDNLKRNFEND